MMAGAGASPYGLASDAASRLGIAVGAEELATLASDLDLGDGEMAAVAATFSYLAEKRRLASIETLLRLSRLPRREPKTFEGFDFSRIQGRDAAALGKLPSLADLYAHRNVAFIGPGGIGKTHLAQAYGREFCMRGLKTYYIKATELRDRFQKAVQRGNPSRVVSSLVKPSCLIVDEVGRCCLRQAVHRPVLRRRRQALREGGAERDGPHEQHRTERVGRVLHGRRHAPLRPLQAVRQGIGVRDAGPELPRQGARHVLGGGRPPGGEGEGDPARGDVGKR